MVAKRFGFDGCVAVKTKHGKELSSFTRKLQEEIGLNGIQLVVISRPNAYGEYEPYEM
uniref:DUF6718 family protein n=1 Tax=Enterocloster aldenensis TaxID=358742 RepID=UPI00336BD4ED